MAMLLTPDRSEFWLVAVLLLLAGGLAAALLAAVRGDSPRRRTDRP